MRKTKESESKQEELYGDDEPYDAQVEEMMSEEAQLEDIQAQINLKAKQEAKSRKPDDKESN